MAPPLKISVITPSFNRPNYLQETIDSITSQTGPFELEYILVDGGSGPDTLDLIKKNEGVFTHWVSEPDDGMYHAISKGMAMASGDVLAWLNTDDVYLPGALSVVARVFEQLPAVQWMSSLSQALLDADGDLIDVPHLAGVCQRAFYDGVFCGYATPDNPMGSGFIMQEATFFRRALWEAAGENRFGPYKVAGDFALWTRFMELAPPAGIRTPLSAFRLHGKDQLSSKHVELYYSECRQELARAGAALGIAPRQVDTDSPVTYEGLFVEKTSVTEAGAPWQLSSHEFAVAPQSEIKNVLQKRRLM